MPWISVASVRHLLLEDLKYPLTHPVVARRAAFKALKALMAEELDVFAQVAEIGAGIVRQEWTSWLRGLNRKSSLGEAAHLLTLTCLCHLRTGDHVSELQSFTKVDCLEEPGLRALQQVIALLFGKEHQVRERAGGGHVESDAEWYQYIENRPIDVLFDLALTPEHRRWSTLAHFVTPLALVLAQQDGDGGGNRYKRLRYGAHPARRGEILYERVNQRPAWGTCYSQTDRTTWVGFDAIEHKNNEIFVYHYLGSTWQAPLIFDEDVNAFRFLDELVSSWQLVQENASPDQWHLMERAIAEGRCTHVVVYDSNVAMVMGAHLQRAAEHYDVRLTARDLLEVG